MPRRISRQNFATPVETLTKVHAELSRAKHSGEKFSPTAIARKHNIGVGIVVSISSALNLPQQKILRGVALFRGKKAISVVSSSLQIPLATAQGIRHLFKIIDGYKTRLHTPTPQTTEILKLIAQSFDKTINQPAILELIKRFKEETGRSPKSRDEIFAHFNVSETIRQQIIHQGNFLRNEKIGRLLPYEIENVVAKIKNGTFDLADASKICYAEPNNKEHVFKKYPLIRQALIEKGLLKK
ncbi:MAG: hypothetical protein Q7K42_03795 [Candidatus Diapherotrites archaeon]|nr:hypothetical protein [Candidatus Diapherotrites archaeon]